MKRVSLLRVFHTAYGTSSNRGFQTGAVLLGRIKAGKVPRKPNYEPGLRHREAAITKEPAFAHEIEYEDFEENLDLMNVDDAYDLNEFDEEQDREKLKWILTKKKFFKAHPQPPTLTCNERECIRYLHKADPVQWDVQTLSESFPATPEMIKRVLKGKFRLSAELRRKLDRKVQKNWDLLAKGELEAAPEVLEHLKKFTNRREVLLEQIKNANFYLPEVKKEVVWNNGEMSDILVHYEKAVLKLSQKHALKNADMLGDNSEANNSKADEKPSLDVVHEKIDEFQKHRNLEGKESFTLGGMIKAYSKPLTLEELKTSLLLKADKKEPLHVTEKAIVESAMGRNTYQNLSNPHKRELSQDYARTENLEQGSTEKSFSVKAFQQSKVEDKKKLEKLIMNDEKKKFLLPDSNTKFFTSNELGKALGKVFPEKNDRDRSQAAVQNNTDLSHTEKAEREIQYYNSQVKDLENTAFWNRGRTSQDRALAENEKTTLGGPDICGRGNVYRGDVYPERIQIPRNKQGSGLTFRVKDCYYDDDGEFLYRVPGMVK